MVRDKEGRRGPPSLPGLRAGRSVVGSGLQDHLGTAVESLSKELVTPHTLCQGQAVRDDRRQIVGSRSHQRQDPVDVGARRAAAGAIGQVLVVGLDRREGVTISRRRWKRA